MIQTTKTKVSEILEGVIDLLNDSKRWTKHHYAVLPNGNPTKTFDPRACKFCIIGAIRKVTRNNKDLEKRTVAAVSSCIDASVFRFNDDPRTTHTHVMSVLTKALGITRDQERYLQ